MPRINKGKTEIAINGDTLLRTAEGGTENAKRINEDIQTIASPVSNAIQIPPTGIERAEAKC